MSHSIEETINNLKKLLSENCGPSRNPLVWNPNKAWTNFQDLEIIEAELNSSIEELVPKCRAFLLAISKCTDFDIILDVASHVCIRNPNDLEKVIFILHPYMKNVSKTKSDQATGESTSNQNNLGTVILSEDNKEWYSLLETNPRDAVLILTGLAYSLVKVAKIDAKGLLSRYNRPNNSIASQITEFHEISGSPDKFTVSFDFLDRFRIFLKQPWDASINFKKILFPSLHFKREYFKSNDDQTKKDQNRYLDLLLMSSLRFNGMKTIELILELAVHFRQKPLEFVHSLKKEDEDVVKFFETYYNTEDELKNDPAIEWARCIDDEYFTDIRPAHSRQIFSYLVAIYSIVFPNSGILSSTLVKKLEFLINLHKPLAIKYVESFYKQTQEYDT